ncbi:MAG: hypothetical protein ACJ72D_02205 [Marmoricola sp.]
MSRPTAPALVLAGVVLSLLAAGCGADPAPVKASTTQSLKECRSQWHDVAESVIGLDQDTDPSALASRWTSVVATVDYYRTAPSAKGCQANVETQLKAITLLRQFSERLRPYDMAYQLRRVSASIDLYLHDALPAAQRNGAGKLVRPPTKAAVSAAMATLTSKAATANDELQPGWEQLASVELEDSAAVASALQDLDFLAQDSPGWRESEAALQVLVAAVQAQEQTTGVPAG